MDLSLMNTQVDDEKILRQMIADWSGAAQRRDYEGVLAHHAADFLMFDVPPPFQSEGLAEYRKTWDLLFGSMADPPTFDFSDVRVTIGADLAFATAHGRCLSMEHGEVTEIHFWLTMCFQKRDDEWVVVHEHHSVPAM
jgi:ketosteroid isomerase-like protein